MKLLAVYPSKCTSDGGEHTKVSTLKNEKVYKLLKVSGIMFSFMFISLQVHWLVKIVEAPHKHTCAHLHIIWFLHNYTSCVYCLQQGCCSREICEIFQTTV